MITLKFPGLHNALTKDTKDLDQDDPRKGVIVISGTAIVITDFYLIACNLRDYFQIEEGIESDDELAELDKLLYYMNEKCFSKEFWKELTSGSNMEIIEGSISLESPRYSKDLRYKELPVSFIEPLKKIAAVKMQAVKPLDCVAVPFGALERIFSVHKTSFKLDYIIFEFTTQDMPVKFTFRNRKHFYGIIKPHYDAAQEGFKFESMGDFADETAELLDELIEEEKSKVPPPPPPKKEEPKEEQPDNQLKLVED